MNLVCINCPRGCKLTVEEVNGEVQVSGNFCPRGINYGVSELKNPLRTLTTTVPISSKKHQRLPIMSAQPLPKGMIMEAMKALKDVRVEAPVRAGDVIVAKVAGTDCDMVAAKTISE